MVIFSLFSNKVTEDEKSRIAARLLTIADPVDFPAEKPDFPDVLDTTQLVDLVGSNSWFIFHRLKLDSDWLKENVGLWSKNESYQEMETFVRTVKTTNDTAERAENSCLIMLQSSVKMNR